MSRPLLQLSTIKFPALLAALPTDEAEAAALIGNGVDKIVDGSRKYLLGRFNAMREFIVVPPNGSFSSCSGGTDPDHLTVGSRQQLGNYVNFCLGNFAIVHRRFTRLQIGDEFLPRGEGDGLADPSIVEHGPDVGALAGFPGGGSISRPPHSRNPPPSSDLSSLWGAAQFRRTQCPAAQRGHSSPGAPTGRPRRPSCPGHSGLDMNTSAAGVFLLASVRVDCCRGRVQEWRA